MSRKPPKSPDPSKSYVRRKGSWVLIDNQVAKRNKSRRKSNAVAKALEKMRQADPGIDPVLLLDFFGTKS